MNAASSLSSASTVRHNDGSTSMGPREVEASAQYADGKVPFTALADARRADEADVRAADEARAARVAAEVARRAEEAATASAATNAQQSAQRKARENLSFAGLANCDQRCIRR